MQLTVDLHSHSGYSGGVGQLSLEAVAQTMKKKGINVFGTGDCLQGEWLAHLETSLQEEEPGLFSLDGCVPELRFARFLLQTEIIITAPAPGGGRKPVHVALFFPSFASVRDAIRLMEKWESKLKIGRPFLKCDDAAAVSQFLSELWAIDESIGVIPAHVMLPLGIYGSDRPITFLHEFFGEMADRIRIMETGLSADPEILALIPELDNRTLISNSDCHSAALNRVGREYTALEVESPSYENIITSLRNGKVLYTAEFAPSEGRYFLTGHRAGKRGHEDGAYCYFSPDTVPDGNICPVCSKPLTVGVLQRAIELCAAQGGTRSLDNTPPRQKSVHMVPLVEVVAAGLGVKSVSSKKVISQFESILTVMDNEAEVWQCTDQDLERRLAGVVPAELLDALFKVRTNDFTFDPLGYDGEYGNLVIGQHGGWFGQKVVSSQ